MTRQSEQQAGRVNHVDTIKRTSHPRGDDCRAATRTLGAAVEVHLLPNRSKPMKSLLSSVSTSMVVHAIILFALSWIYFDLPKRTVLESILWLTKTDNESATDVVLDARGSPELNIEIGAAKELMDSPEESIHFAPLTVDSQHISWHPESIEHLTRQRIDQAAITIPKAAGGKLATTGKSANQSKSAAKVWRATKTKCCIRIISPGVARRQKLRCSNAWEAPMPAKQLLDGALSG